MKTAIYLQFTNPGAYPPLIQSSNILLAAGWGVEFLGVQSRGSSRNIVMPAREGRHVRMLPWVEPGLRQKLHYMRFVLWAVGHCTRQRADLVYCSDPFACLPGMLLRRVGFRVIYHEHDSPNPGEEDSLPGPVARARRWLLRNASLVIFPNARRLERARQWAGGMAESKVVWNCPGASEVGRDIVSQPRALKLYYHGAIVPGRPALSIIEALSKCEQEVTLTIVGYETVGSDGYIGVLIELARRLGVGDAVTVRSAMPRHELLSESRHYHIGLSLFGKECSEAYLSEMAGASNKPFDYLSQGLAVIVPDTSEWRNLYMATGCGVTADPNDADSLAALFDHLARHPDEVREMGQRGREKIRREWNYERQFAPVMEWLERDLDGSEQTIKGRQEWTNSE